MILFAWVIFFTKEKRAFLPSGSFGCDRKPQWGQWAYGSPQQPCHQGLKWDRAHWCAMVPFETVLVSDPSTGTAAAASIRGKSR